MLNLEKNCRMKNINNNPTSENENVMKIETEREEVSEGKTNLKPHIGVTEFWNRYL